MSPTLLEGLLFLLLAALLAAYIGGLVFAWWPQRRRSAGSTAPDRPDAPRTPGSDQAPGPDQAVAARSTHAAAEGDESHVS